MNATIPARPHSATPAVLVVHHDGHGWRLFWGDQDRPWIGCEDESEVTGQPYFRTKREAVAYGQCRYGERAMDAYW